MFWYSMIFGWLRAAEMMQNPFGSPLLSGSIRCQNDFCLDMFAELEVEIWKASISLENQDIIPMNDM